MRKEPANSPPRSVRAKESESLNPGLSLALRIPLRTAWCREGAREFRLQPPLAVEGEERVRRDGCPWDRVLTVLWDISAPLTLGELELLSRNHYFLAGY